MLQQANVTRRVSEIRIQCLRLSKDPGMHPQKQLLAALFARYFDETISDKEKDFLEKAILSNFGYGKYDRKRVLRLDGSEDEDSSVPENSDGAVSAGDSDMEKLAERRFPQLTRGGTDGSTSTGSASRN